MKKLRIIAIIALIISFGLTAMSQQKVYKIKPIKGKKNAIIQNQDLATGMTKWSVSLERLSGQASDIYLPSDALVLAEGNGYNPPNPSNSIKINSAKTADGFLFNAKGPKNNNIQIHLKKSASSNSSYTLEVNLRQGEKYEFPIYYLPNQYLMVRGSASDYENMVSSISSNQYFTESLSYVDDEFAKYQSEPNLVWWAEAFVGVFQDYVDVEAIGDVVPLINLYSYTITSLEEETSWFEWKCGSSINIFPIEKNQILVLTAESECLVALSVGGRYLECAYSFCPLPDPNDPWNSEDQWKMCVFDCQRSEQPVPGQQCQDRCKDTYEIQRNACKLDCGSNSSCLDSCYDEAQSSFQQCWNTCNQQ